MAVLIVSGFSSLVDWRKEKEFVGRLRAEEAAQFVSYSDILSSGSEPNSCVTTFMEII